DTPLRIHHGHGAAVDLPHDLSGGAEALFGRAAANVSGHDVFDLHLRLPSGRTCERGGLYSKPFASPHLKTLQRGRYSRGIITSWSFVTTPARTTTVSISSPERC